MPLCCTLWASTHFLFTLHMFTSWHCHSYSYGELQQVAVTANNSLSLWSSWNIFIHWYAMQPQPLSIKCHLSSTSYTMSCNNLPNDSRLMVRLTVEIIATGRNCKIFPLKFHLTVTHTWPHYLRKIWLQRYSPVITEVAWFWNMIIQLMACDNLTLVGEKFYRWLCISEIFKKVTYMMPMVICSNETNCHWHSAGYLILLSFTGI